MTDQPTAELREETMLYREPTPETDETAVQDIWGRRLETRIVEAGDVPALLEQGWVSHPLELGKSPEERAGFERVPGKADKELAETRLALETAEKLVAEQEKRLDQLTQANIALQEERDRARADLKAAEELADAETKAKEALQAELAAIRAEKPKPAGK